MPVRPLGTTKLLLDIFSWSLIFEYFSNTCPEKWSDNVTRITCNLYEDVCTFMAISHSVFRWSRNVSDEGIEKIKTTLHVQYRFSKNRGIYEIKWETCCRAREATNDRINTAYAHCVLDNCGYKHKFRTKVMRTRLRYTYDASLIEHRLRIDPSLWGKRKFG